MSADPALERAVQRALASRNFAQLATWCEEVELNSAAAQHNLDPAIYSVLLFAFYLADELTHAKHCWKRIPHPVRAASSELRAAWTVGQHLWTAQDAEPGRVFNSLAVYSWSPLTAKLVELLQAHLRDKILASLARSHSRITLKTVQEHLACSEADGLRLATASGWTHAGGVLTPPQRIAVAPDASSAVREIARLAEYAAFVETGAVRPSGGAGGGGGNGGSGGSSSSGGGDGSAHVRAGSAKPEARPAGADTESKH